MIQEAVFSSWEKGRAGDQFTDGDHRLESSLDPHPQVAGEVWAGVWRSDGAASTSVVLRPWGFTRKAAKWIWRTGVTLPDNSTPLIKDKTASSRKGERTQPPLSIIPRDGSSSDVWLFIILFLFISVWCLLFLISFWKIFIYWAAPGLSCDTQDFPPLLQWNL